MTNPEDTMMTTPEYPFLHNKIPVVNGLEGFTTFSEQYPGFNFCPYVAKKDPDGWDKSTSRVYMNQVLPDFLYVPVDIAKDDLPALREFFEAMQSREDVPAINITQPHKSSPVLREMYMGDIASEANVDTLIRNEAGELAPYDLNSTAFVEWYKADVGTLQDKTVILIGVGGVGEPIAKKIAAEKPASLRLVDIADKSEFAARLAEVAQVNAIFEPNLQAMLRVGLPTGAVIINAAGKEGASDESELWRLIQKGLSGGVFVDIRPHLDINIVEEAKRLGWQAHTGYGMNARNDYVLLQGIARQIPGARSPTFDTFQRLVAAAS